MRQNPVLVKAIFEARAAEAAIEMFNGGEEGQAELKKHPELANLLLELKRAQNEE